MNILFYTVCEVSPLKGGTERITSTIATSLQTLYNVKCYSIFSNRINASLSRTSFENSKQIARGANFESELYNFIKQYDIDIIVNQGEFSLAPVMHNVLNRFTGKYLVTAHHFSPGAEELFLDIHSTIMNIKFRKKVLKNMVKAILYPVLKWSLNKTVHKNYERGYKNSDRIVLLSANFKQDFIKYAHLSEDSKFRVIHNALSFSSFFDMKEYDKKEKEVLIVSRLNENQKRISLALRIWEIIEKKVEFKEWSLKIVGHGGSYEMYRRFVATHNLQRVSFEGAQDSERYYKKASLFMLTSSYEGWGLTLTEAQQNGCVPIAFDSYASLTDIITEGENGFIIPDNNIYEYAKKMEILMNNRVRRKNMAINAINSSKRFQVEKICADWMNLFTELKRKKI